VNDEDGIAGISRGNCRLFITGPSFREPHGNLGPTLFWLNLENKAEVDELYEEWIAKGARVVFEPEDKAWMMREFTITDLAGNVIRVFYDFRADVLQAKSC
jgi:uncharacterized glyoxalase superfamily protein PhnB